MDLEPDHDTEPSDEADIVWPLTFAERRAIARKLGDIIANGESQRIQLAGVRYILEMEKLNMQFSEARNRRLLAAIKKLESRTES
ncbi:hypothetical protein U8335_02300 [Roseiconus lacunae]|uniref:hypothetical protein n=1 Tax=Roseiconus lacunae TaxID=2605694 RepID=UPI00308F2787|nr:hypothetical protein U8335_02300 [Stieleria sp. HD01]